MIGGSVLDAEALSVPGAVRGTGPVRVYDQGDEMFTEKLLRIPGQDCPLRK